MIWVYGYIVVCLFIFMAFTFCEWHLGNDIDMSALFLFFFVAFIPVLNLIALIAGLVGAYAPDDRIIIRGRKK